MSWGSFAAGAVFAVFGVYSLAAIFDYRRRLKEAIERLQSEFATSNLYRDAVVQVTKERDEARRSLEEFMKKPLVVVAPDDQMDRLVEATLARQGAPAKKSN